MKRLLMSLFAVTAFAFTSGIVHADPDSPSPLKGVMMPFPWDSISGVWNIDDPSLGSIFSFDVKKTQDGNKVLTVLQVDAKTGQVIAHGAGVAIPGDKNTVSVMMVVEGQDPYMLFVRNIREKRYSRKKSTVVTIKPLETGNNAALREHNYRLNRVSMKPLNSQEAYYDDGKY